MLCSHSARKALLIGIMTLSLTACSLFSGQETSGQYIDDAATTTKIKKSFMSDPIVEASHINVETMQGTVQLSGFVTSAKSEARAVELARNTKGVVAIKDNIIVQ